MIYVLSDIHGHRRRFDSIMSQIDLRPEDTLYVLGDVIDRNPHGIRILRQLMSMSNVKMLLGNHEYMMLDALYYPHDDYAFGWQYRQEQRMELWYCNGGAVTHNYLKHIRKTLRAEIFEYLDSLPLNAEISVNDKRYILTHAAPVALFDEYRLFTRYKYEKDFAMWYRFNGNEEYPYDATVVFGHTVTRHYQNADPLKIWHGKGLIGIDCGAAYPDTESPLIRTKGRLACLRLDDMKEYYSEEV